VVVRAMMVHAFAGEQRSDYFPAYIEVTWIRALTTHTQKHTNTHIHTHTHAHAHTCTFTHKHTHTPRNNLVAYGVQPDFQ